MTSSDDRYARRLYALLMFEIWNRVFVDRTEAPKETAGRQVHVYAQKRHHGDESSRL
jgi:hypothetical protein